MRRQLEGSCIATKRGVFKAVPFFYTCRLGVVTPITKTFSKKPTKQRKLVFRCQPLTTSDRTIFRFWPLMSRVSEPSASLGLWVALAAQWESF
eukprot:m.169413 g.169413  ORF g.169413 m.169413 type:complete len:93 (-) comp16475_c0_seq3:2940-3218(-)